MKYFRVIYVPIGRRDKEWTVWEGKSKEQVFSQFKAGDIIKIEEISKEEFEENFEDY